MLHAWYAPDLPHGRFAGRGRGPAQEIFLQACRKLGSFKGDATLGTWLYRLAINHCLDFVRSRQGKNRKLTTTHSMTGQSSRPCPPDTPVTRIDLERAVQSLPDGCREPSCCTTSRDSTTKR